MYVQYLFTTNRHMVQVVLEQLLFRKVQYIPTIPVRILKHISNLASMYGYAFKYQNRGYLVVYSLIPCLCEPDYTIYIDYVRQDY